MFRSGIMRNFVATKVLLAAGLVLAPGMIAQVPAVSRTEPAAVALIPGGSAVTVILYGQNLQLLEKATVVANGRKINGAQATLQDGGSSTQRNVLVSAGSKAKIGTQAVLEVSSGKGRQSTKIDAVTVKFVATATIWYADMDGDLFGDSNVTREAATQPADFVARGSDCDDTNPDLRP
ncbi:MAG: hypothetical protein V3S56_05140, partial [Gemmatimonadota bacterium]